MDLQASAAGKAGHRLSPAMTRQMMTPVKDNWGLGVAVYSSGIPRFMHDGVNEGYESYMIAYTDKGDGVVAYAGWAPLMVCHVSYAQMHSRDALRTLPLLPLGHGLHFTPSQPRAARMARVPDSAVDYRTANLAASPCTNC
jgi:hypothetical protein